MSRLTKKEANRLSCHSFRKCEYLLNGTPRVKALNKLGELEDLEELHGCPLNAVFEALENGAWVKDKDWGLCHWTMPYIARDYDSRNTPKATLYLTFEKSGQKRYFALKDFRKTWSIRKEDLL